MDREMLLEKVKEVLEQRGDRYGEPENNFQSIANYWNIYLDRFDLCITPKDVAFMMLLLKLARHQTGKAHFDNFVDMIGYISCACDCTDFSD